MFYPINGMYLHPCNDDTISVVTLTNRGYEMNHAVKVLANEYKALRKRISKIEHSDMLSDCSFIDPRQKAKHEQYWESMRDIERFVSHAGEKAYSEFYAINK